MNMNLLRITSKPALIDIKTTNAKVRITQPPADFDMKIEHPRVEIKTKLPKVIIDQSQPFAEAGLKGYSDLNREMTQLAKQDALKGIERRVREGNQMADIHKGSDPIPDQAYYNAFELYNKEFNFKLIPTSRPKIDLQEAQVDVKFHRGKVNIKSKPNKPIVEYERGKVETYLKQKNSIHIEYLGNKIDQTL